jgi:hypothetical protein
MDWTLKKLGLKADKPKQTSNTNTDLETNTNTEPATQQINETKTVRKYEHNE